MAAATTAKAGVVARVSCIAHSIVSEGLKRDNGLDFPGLHRARVQNIARRTNMERLDVLKILSCRKRPESL